MNSQPGATAIGRYRLKAISRKIATGHTGALGQTIEGAALSIPDPS